MTTNKKPKRLGKERSLTKYVVFSITVLIVYSVVNLIITLRTGYTNDTLTTCIFATFGGEILSCALIKIFKLRSNANDE